MSSHSSSASYSVKRTVVVEEPVYNVEMFRIAVFKPQWLLLPTPLATFCVMLSLVGGKWHPTKVVLFGISLLVFAADLVSSILFFVFYLCSQRPNPTYAKLFLFSRVVVICFFAVLFVAIVLDLFGLRAFDSLVGDVASSIISLGFFVFVIILEGLVIYSVKRI